MLGLWGAVLAAAATVHCGGGDSCDDPLTETVEKCASGSGSGSGAAGTSGSSCNEPAMSEDYLTGCSSRTWVAYDTYDTQSSCFNGSTITFTADETMYFEDGCTGQSLTADFSFHRITSGQGSVGYDDTIMGLWLEGSDFGVSAFGQSFSMTYEGSSGSTSSSSSGGGGCDGSLGFTSVGAPCGASLTPRCEDIDGVKGTVSCDQATCTWQFLEYCNDCPSGSYQICINGATCGCSAQSS
jgi:hypothetical protein